MSVQRNIRGMFVSSIFFTLFACAAIQDTFTTSPKTSIPSAISPISHKLTMPC
ncbi:hypothetical protein PR003_g34640 [Phytophthora rubi]|uniref:RxLR effector protein n=1 Tax=Phytophthora rubi TaxID=129364 RepID=A0A6A4AMS9_9STRA|nr:hypothetical protein PR001_g32876 [Phytophthora rubi]KAE8953904.1 hypothetical protein PR002_g32234 [Phytophthora rubi]KAE9259772.1 hypothetical protein PR003_g34640 [Phytophthora rubi]